LILKHPIPKTTQKLGHLFAATLFSAAAFFGLSQQSANAATAKIDSCYQLVMLGDINPPVPTRDLYVLVDQTMELPEKLQEETYQKIIDFLSPGDTIQIIGFSANAAGFYTEVILKGVIDTRLIDDVRYSVSKKILRQLDQCYETQDTQVRQYAGLALIHAFSKATTELPKTEIVSNLSVVAKDIIAKSETPEKYVLIVSDMMENSDLLSLYGTGKLEALNVDQEISKLSRKLAFENMDKAKVYVIGGGYLANGKYRSSLALKALENFWASYFEHSNAELKQFGTPSLLSGIGN
jgi:hypothetical protein